MWVNIPVEYPSLRIRNKARNKKESSRVSFFCSSSSPVTAWYTGGSRRTDRQPARGGPASASAPHNEGFCEAKDEEETTAKGAKPTRPGALPRATTRAAATHGCTPCPTAVEQDAAPPCRSGSHGKTTRRSARRQGEDGL